MKAILEFTLPDDATEHKDAVDGSRWKAVVWELDQELRAIEKHGDDSATAARYRQRLRDVMEDNGLMFE